MPFFIGSCTCSFSSICFLDPFLFRFQAGLIVILPGLLEINFKESFFWKQRL